jgi:phosphoglycolate phosphatase-like HAD superfamily hydrolase/tRNA(Arg) A34 adenosine deaminase TadA
MALDGIIFDVDGTLADTNGHHVDAWLRAFERHGYKVFRDRVESEIGKGGDHLVPSILGCEADEKDGEKLRAAQKEEFLAIAARERFELFDGALDLMKVLRDRGLALAIATSGGKENLEAIEKSAGVALSDLVDVVVTADDADRSKPSPDLVVASYRKLGLAPGQCGMIGDTIYDAGACRHAGVVLLGLLSGFNDEKSLMEAGARAVYDDVGDLLDHLDAALDCAAPGPARLTQEMTEKLMREALDVARRGMGAGEMPVGCVLARGDGTIVARGHNDIARTGNTMMHAEIIVLATVAGKIPSDARDLLIVSTLEPCVMCTGAAMQGGVDAIIYALRAPADSGTDRVRSPGSAGTRMPRIIGDILAAESRALFEEWLRANGDSPGASYVRELLKSR